MMVIDTRSTPRYTRTSLRSLTSILLAWGAVDRRGIDRLIP
jgi:hypothetical protein